MDIDAKTFRYWLRKSRIGWSGAFGGANATVVGRNQNQKREKSEEAVIRPSEHMKNISLSEPARQRGEWLGDLGLRHFFSRDTLGQQSVRRRID